MAAISPEGGPWHIAHRGARDEAPENTRSAFEKALAYPIDGIELDVQMSADGVPVIYHDATLWRVARRRRRISQMTAGQLARLDWGRWYHADFAGEPLLTLEETLSRFAARTRLLIEIKALPEVDNVRLLHAVLDQLASLPEQVPRAHIFVLCFDLAMLRRAHAQAPQWRYVYNVPGRRPEQIMGLADDETAFLWAIDVPIGHLSQRLVDWASWRGLRVCTYTCNTAAQVRKALGLGVDVILTDRPGWLTEYLGGR